MDRLDTIRKKVSDFPKTPGIYIMKDDRGQVLYVGKAKDLRSRAGSYFQPSTEHGPKNQKLVAAVHDIEYVPAESEVEALLMESRLIKDVQPKYNIELKDGKTYPLLAITHTDDFPMIEVTRERKPGAQYYGPFTDVSGLRESVRILQKIFKFRTCTLSIHEGDDWRKYFRPCLLKSLSMCTAPCTPHVDKETYAEQIKGFRDVLTGRKRDVIRTMTADMERAAAELDFEQAARLRDQIKSLESLDKRAKLGQFPTGDVTPLNPLAGCESLRDILGLDELPRRIDGVDIAQLGGEDSVGSLVTFRDGSPWKSGYRRFKIKHVDGIDDFGMIREVVTRRFRRIRDDEPEVMPDILLIDGGKGQLNAAAAALESVGLGVPVLLSLAKKEEIVFRHGHDAPIRLPRRSPGLRLLQYIRDEAHRFAQHYHHLLRRKAMFKPGRKSEK
jgi:excinuclease ABC subunit C